MGLKFKQQFHWFYLAFDIIELHFSSHHFKPDSLAYQWARSNENYNDKLPISKEALSKEQLL